MICQHCGKEISDNSTFCRFCGTECRKASNPVQEVRYCRKCGAELTPGAGFCRKCGARVVTVDQKNTADMSPRSESRKTADTAVKAARQIAGKLLQSVTADASPVAGEQKFSMSVSDKEALFAVINTLKGGR